MMMRKSAAAGGAPKRSASSGIGAGASKQMPTLQDFLSTRDFTGANTLLEFQRRTDTMDANTLPWLAFCAFHLGDYQRALDVYSDISTTRAASPETALCRACCLYYLQHYKEAEAAALAAPDHPLKTRLLFHLCYKLNKEQDLVKYHARLQPNSKHDQLTLAAMQVRLFLTVPRRYSLVLQLTNPLRTILHSQYMRSHYQEATDIYKKLLLENRNDIALNAYIAMCYYKLDYYEASGPH
jgi:intraflagellar transport protein 56